MGRNAIVNVAEIVCYDLVKENIIKAGILKDNMPCHFTSAVIAGSLYFRTNIIIFTCDQRMTLLYNFSIHRVLCHFVRFTC